MLLARMQLHSSPSNPAHGKSHASHVLPKPSQIYTYLTHQQMPYYELHFHLLAILITFHRQTLVIVINLNLLST